MHTFKITELIILVFLFGCSEPKKAERPVVTPEQQAQMESFSNELINSINGFEFSLINNTWNNEAFKERVATHINKTQQSVFNHIFEKDLRMTIKTGNLNIIHRVNSENGKISFLRLTHFDFHSELTLLLTFDGRFDFFKYRIEIINNKPAITDFYHFMDNLWYSEKLVNILRLNSKFDAYSDERHQANRAIRASDKALTYGDTLEALYSLYDIPETHQLGNGLSLMKLNLALTLGDSIYANVLATEYEKNKSLYMKYLYTLYFDSTNLNSVYQLLTSELGSSATLDTLVNKQNYWN